MNEVMGGSVLLVFLAILIGVVWLSIALVIAQFRTARATEKSADLLTRIARKLDPPQENADGPSDTVTFYDLKNTAEEREWRNGQITTKAELEAYRRKRG